MGNLAEVDDRITSGLFLALLLVVGAISLTLGSIAYQNSQPDVAGDLVFRIDNDPTVQQAVDESVARNPAVQRNSRKITAVQGVRAGSATNVDLSNVPAVVDGVTLVVGDRVLLFGQTNAGENGPYEVDSLSSWAPSLEELNAGLPMYIAEGDTHGGTLRIIQGGTSGKLAGNNLAITGSSSYTNWPSESLPQVPGVLVSDPISVSGLNFSQCPNVSGTLTVNGAMVANTLTINGNAIVSETLTVPSADVGSINATGGVTSASDGLVVQYQLSADTTLLEEWSGSVISVTPSGSDVALTLPHNPRNGTYYSIEVDASSQFTYLELQSDRFIYGTLANTASGLSLLPSTPAIANLEAGPGITTGQTKSFIGVIFVSPLWHIQGIASGWRVRAVKP